jgi:hypothetical protein
MHHKLLKTDAWQSLFPQGTVLWRTVSFTSMTGNIEVEDWTPVKTEKGSYMCRCLLEGHFTWEPQVHPATYRHDSYRGVTDLPSSGLVVFVDSQPPPRWTHLIVTGVSKVLKEPGRPEKGAALFCTVPRPYDMNDYKDFRRRMYNVYTQNLNADIEGAIDHSLKIWVAGQTPEELRLVNKIAAVEPEVQYYYAHLRLRSQDSKPRE